MGAKRKKAKVIVLSIGVLLLMMATIPAAIWVTHTQAAELGNDSLRCQQDTARHVALTVTLQNEQAVPSHITGKACDTLTISNADTKDRLIAFGSHEHHISYDGVSERVLAQGQSLTVVLVKSGTYLFHDHTDPAVKGSFTVYGDAPK